MVAGAIMGKKFIIVKHFEGDAKAENVSMVDLTLPPIKDGEILVEAEFLSVDPYMRPFSVHLPLGTAMPGSMVGKIIESKNANWPVGKRLVGYFGWVTHVVCNPDSEPDPFQIAQQKPYLLPDFGDLPSSLGLGVLGMPGNTAYFGFLELCKPKSGETLVVSGAAGAVGSHVGQIGKILGLRVIGIAGSPEKCRWLVDELGFDHAINYKTENVRLALKKAAPNGVDCYFDNVGGETTSIVIHQMNEFGRISVCGSISAYNENLDCDRDDVPKVPLITPALIFKQIKMEGFMVMRWLDRWQEGIDKNLAWIREGKLKYKETHTQGFENMFEAFLGVMKGVNVGKAIVKV